MTGSIGAFDAKTRLGDLLDRVEHGEAVTITRRGRPVARIVPVAAEGEDAQRAATELRELRRANRLEGLDWKALRDEGRR
jgi:prevent-host-death family protein